MSKILIRNGLVITMNQTRQCFRRRAIVIKGDVIQEVLPSDQIGEQDYDQVIDVSGKIVLPGLINTHVHTSQQLGRGLGDDVSLLTWLFERIWPYESNMTAEDSYVSTLLCAAELIRSGVTTFAEAGGQHVDGMGRAIKEVGLRGILARSTMDSGEGVPPKMAETTEQTLAIQEELLRRWHGSADGLIRFWFSLRQILNNSDILIMQTKALADHYGVGIHMHVGEIPYEIEFVKEKYGHEGTVTHLAAIGALGTNFLGVHSVWLSEAELDLYAKYGAKVSHCPAAAMRVLGFAKIPEMIQRGITVGLGTDGAPSNNRMCLVDEMYLTALVHKGRKMDPTVLPAQKIIEMVTIDGARALLWEDQIGSLEPGKKADLIIVNPNSANMLPLHDPIANLVASLQGHNIESVMVDGRWLMWEHRLTTIDEGKVYKESQERAAAIVKRAGIRLPERFPCL
ncbi:MAG: amidohydrolase [Chloroflexi bacterium]|nr:amidohydrolase [Chloroflexota bacterium]MCL5075852.1 amidohydrolase [Chloroflexota bacterium]